MGGGAWPFLVGGAICLVRDALRCSRGAAPRYTDVFNEVYSLGRQARSLQLLVFNEEFLVSASHQLALTTPPPFVHTARRSLPIEWSVKCSIKGDVGGEPAEGSLSIPRKRSADLRTKLHHDAPRRRARRVRTPVESPRLQRSRPGADGLSVQRPTTVRDAEHTNNHSARSVLSERGSARRSHAAWPWRPTSNTNPANHRVFERKLHPRPLGQGYTCLGVTPDVFSPHPVRFCPTAGGAAGRRGRADWSSLPPLARLAEKHFAPRALRHDEWWLRPPWPCVARSRVRGPGSEEDPCRQLPP
ncbi:hypothetical protein H6P81_021331 [Aristolochia fimbriata]|uniref:Uncharacterized protein n=1 Tax=Aristolochia fimbriata TaxID=158543 RepID=A0AAV7DSV9_ARIFI|nr:hypothetical protein H6P81_021331 [Aristolochia fimbriata]